MTSYDAARLITLGAGIYVTYSLFQESSYLALTSLISEIVKGTFIGAVASTGLVYNLAPPNHYWLKLASPVIGAAIGGIVGGALQLVINQKPMVPCTC